MIHISAVNQTKVRTSTCYISLFLKKNPHYQPRKRHKKWGNLCSGFLRPQPRDISKMSWLRACAATLRRLPRRGIEVKSWGLMGGMDSRLLPGYPETSHFWDLKNGWLEDLDRGFPKLGQFWRPIFPGPFPVKYLGECNCCQPLPTLTIGVFQHVSNVWLQWTFPRFCQCAGLRTWIQTIEFGKSFKQTKFL